MLSHFDFTTSLVVLAALSATAVKAYGEFLAPWTSGDTKDYSENTAYPVGSKLIVHWTASFKNATIELTQDNKPGDSEGGPSVTLQESYNQKIFNWKVTTGGLDLLSNNVFYFSVSPGDGSSGGFTGHYFNISTADPAAAATTSSASPSSTPSSASSVPASPSPAAPAAAAAVSSSSGDKNSNGTPPGTIAGIVVATVVGTLLLVAAAWWVWRIQKKRRNNKDMTGGGVQGHQQQPMEYYAEAPPNEKSHPHEAEGTPVHGIHEAAEGRRIYELQEAEQRHMYELGDSGGRGGPYGV
ncbi:MAG: hypothetical protein Q9168_005841 [Polycauliona sp. 1 TL-2023]